MDEQLKRQLDSTCTPLEFILLLPPGLISPFAFIAFMVSMGSRTESDRHLMLPSILILVGCVVSMFIAYLITERRLRIAHEKLEQYEGRRRRNAPTLSDLKKKLRKLA